MRKTQRGVSLAGLLVAGFIVVIVALFGMKLVPAILEYQTAKKVVYTIATEGNPSVADIRKSFYARATIDDITAVKAEDLEITKDGGEVVIAFAYRKEVPLAPNFGIYINFTASSKHRDR